MHYSEVLPDDIFSNHIESYWNVPASFNNDGTPIELLLPTCTFNIIFTDKPCQIKMQPKADWEYLNPGATFFGQRHSCILLKADNALEITGVRFKPFAFANILNTPIFRFNDDFTPIESLFNIDASADKLIRAIAEEKSTSTKSQLINELMYVLFKDTLKVDETLRAQLNYIMDRKGAIKVSHLFEKFKVSKVTLRKHFINKVGLTPKKVSQIWRMNYLLQMKEENPSENLTTLALNAGFYDQAHFIKDFKLLFGIAPRKFFSQNTRLTKLAHQNISRRFTNQYDPR
jgi:AraC-like DNA-binding protein